MIQNGQSLRLASEGNPQRGSVDDSEPLKHHERVVIYDEIRVYQKGSQFFALPESLVRQTPLN